MAWCRWEVSMWCEQVSRAEGNCIAGKEKEEEEEEEAAIAVFETSFWCLL